MIDNEALARRAVACKAWRWMPGMVDQHGALVMVVVGGTPVQWADGVCVQDITDRGVDVARRLWAEALPDLADPATLGCLLALVREAWVDSEACVMKGAFSGWRVHAGLGQPVRDWEPRDNYPTEAEALVAALEAAPAREVKS